MRYALTFTTGGFSGTNTLIIDAPVGWGDEESELVDALIKGTGWMEADEAQATVREHSYYLIGVDDVDYYAE